METLEEGGRYVLKLHPGEEVVASILRFVREKGLGGGVLRAIGAVNRARIGFFRPEEKRYETRELRENLEVVSLMGNVAHTEDGPVLHAHVALGRSDLSVVGGHLFEAEVSVTLEAFLTPLSTRVERHLDPRFDLYLLDLSARSGGPDGLQGGAGITTQEKQEGEGHQQE